MSKYIEDLVSIIMPAYNARKNISKSIESVLRQTYEQWELIIIDDGSSDGTLEFVRKKYLDKRIKFYQLPYNQGVAAARNYGIDVSKGRYLAFLDADDSWKPEKLEKQVKFMVMNNLWMSVSAYDIYDKGKFSKKYLPPSEIDYDKQLRGSRIGTLTVMIDQSMVDPIKMPNHGHEDYITWTQLIQKNGKIKSYPESLAIYNRDGGSLSSNKIRAAIWQYKIYKTYFKIPLMRRLYYFICYTLNGVVKHK